MIQSCKSPFFLDEEICQVIAEGNDAHSLRGVTGVLALLKY
jgi:hypothetical protein